MKPYLLFDIGNSNTEYAEYDGTRFYHKANITTKTFVQKITNFNFNNYQKILIASVVPEIDKHFPVLQQIHFINHKNIPEIKLNLERPQEVGADRIVTALGAYHKTKKAALIIDSGTAITFEFIDQNGIYEGGLIFPGMKLCSKALQLYTAKIPLVNIQPSTGLFGKTTKDAVQKGIFQGFIQLINGLISAYKKEYPTIQILGTGKGLLPLNKELHLDAYFPDLVLEGLAACIDYF